MPKSRVPRVIVFDLDFTLWPWWCDCHVSLPIKRVSATKLKDAKGFEMSLFPDVESIFVELHQMGVTIIGASRTATPDVAIEILSSLFVGGKPMIHYFSSLQWGQGSKVRHITRAVKELKLEDDLAAGEVILFDDEIRNRDVKKIKCFFAHIEDETKGLTRGVFEQSLSAWETTTQ